MNLQEKYKKEIVLNLKEKFSYKNIFEIPKIEKIVLNVGVGKKSKDKSYIKNVQENLKNISGQAPVLTKAKKSISGFKVREGAIIGVMVTLRKKRMYDFLEKLVHIYFPRVRDFRGIDLKSVDKNGNLTIGFKESSSFVEANVDDLDKIHGLEVSISTTAKTKEEGEALFKAFGFPFKNN